MQPKIKQLIALAASILFAAVYYILVVKTHQKEEEQLEKPSYDPPVVADSTKHDWVKDDGVCIERRIVYDQMLNEKLSR